MTHQTTQSPYAEASFQSRLACEDLASAATLIRWIWEGIENECSSLGEHEQKLRDTASLLIEVLEYKAKTLEERVYEEWAKAKEASDPPLAEFSRPPKRAAT